MIYSEIIKRGSKFLKKNKIKNPYLDTELILSKVTNKKREEIFPWLCFNKNRAH